MSPRPEGWRTAWHSGPRCDAAPFSGVRPNRHAVHPHTLRAGLSRSRVECRVSPVPASARGLFVIQRSEAERWISSGNSHHARC